jgi:hypothetical protein
MAIFKTQKNPINHLVGEIPRRKKNVISNDTVKT